jgi:hypothetical protein
VEVEDGVHENGGHIAPLKERAAKEAELLEQMRERIAVLDPGSKDVDDATLLRFLRARSMDVTKASKLFAEHQKWRREYFPLGHAQEREIQDEIAGQKYFIQGHDKKGRPLSIFFGAKHFATTSKNREQYKRAVTYFMDKLIASIPAGEETFNVIADLKSVKFKNLDVRGWLGSYDCLQAYYPERLGKVYVLHAPTVFWGAWKMMLPFLDPVTRAKITFVDDDKIEETLLRDINKEEIPTIYGGLKELVPFEVAQPPNWPQFRPVT